MLLLPLSLPRALEDASFPFEHLSEIAELESWRKEINRPIYHLHKWWAQRLGTVFRGILIGALSSDPAHVIPGLYEPLRFPDAVVFDPFMGSGTTIGEALKLGARAIGRDINPVAFFAVKNALGMQDRARILETYRAIEHDISAQLQRLYRTRLGNGREVDVLYFFWVKTLACPSCARCVDLFPSYTFARHAYPGRSPEAQTLCPSCGDVFAGRYDSTQASCPNCHVEFDPQRGPARGTHANCPSCKHSFLIASAVRRGGTPPDHRLYAKLVLLEDGTKAYLPTDAHDESRYDQATVELERRSAPYPVVPIQAGYNTNQVLRYGYMHWHEMFNKRQLLGLSILAERIRSIEDSSLREIFACLFSGLLEFNNMFAS